MSLFVGIVGLPNVGKSTLFQAITKKQVECQNYPFCTIEPNVGVAPVLDERVDKLAQLTRSAKKIYATVDFCDIAGLVEGASKGEGLGNQFLSHIREVDVLVYVLRAFVNDKIVNVRNEINVVKDKEILDMEMALKDLSTVEKRISGLEKDAKTGKKEAVKELELMKKILAFLEQGEVLNNKEWSYEEAIFLKGLQLLTAKPRIYLLNGREDEVSSETRDFFEQNNLPYIVMDVSTEADSAGFTQEERKELGLNESSSLDILIKECYQLLGLITFFTTGPDETRAWNLKKGLKAPQAGGVIHTDFEKSFIRAEVINWNDLLALGGFSQAKGKGMVRTEGKEYVVCDGDVIEILHSA